MTVHRLLHYILRHPDTQTAVSLKQLATEVRQRTNRKAELLCDFSTVVRWVLSSHDREQILNGRLSPYSILYGGDFNSYSNCILKFVMSLDQVCIRPIFFIGTPPGSKQELELNVDKYREATLQVQKVCADMEQVCAGNKDLLQLRWTLSEAMSIQVQLVLKSAGVSVVCCPGQPLTKELHYFRSNHSHVVGIVSNDAELAALIPGLSLFLPDLNDARALSSGHSLAVTTATLAAATKLGEARLPDLVVLCHCDEGVLSDLGLNEGSLEGIITWIGQQTEPISARHPDCKAVMVEMQSRYQLLELGQERCSLEACDESKANMEVSNVDFAMADMSSAKSLSEIVRIKVQSGVMMPHLLSIVEGIYWRSSAMELASLGQPCINNLTLPLRMSLYSLMGLKTVTEYGQTESKSFDTIVVEMKSCVSCGVSQLWSFEDLTTNERLYLLFDLVTNHKHYRDCKDLQECILSAARVGSEFSEPIPTAALMTCASLHLLVQSNETISSFPEIKFFELDALLITCLTCVAGYPPFALMQRPPTRALRTAMYFLHILEQMYLVASYLGLLDELPTPADLFYAMAYIPYHTAGLSEVTSVLPSHIDEQSLTNIQNYFRSLQNLEPVMALSAEIINGAGKPNLPLLIELFTSSVSAVTDYKAQMEDKDGGPSTLPAEKGFNVAMDKVDDLDLSSSFKSDSSIFVKCDELSSAQDFQASEEDFFFTSMFGDINESDIDDDVIIDDVMDVDIFNDVIETSEDMANIYSGDRQLDAATSEQETVGQFGAASMKSVDLVTKSSASPSRPVEELPTSEEMPTMTSDPETVVSNDETLTDPLDSVVVDKTIPPIKSLGVSESLRSRSLPPPDIPTFVSCCLPSTSRTPPPSLLTPPPNSLAPPPYSLALPPDSVTPHPDSLAPPPDSLAPPLAPLASLPDSQAPPLASSPPLSSHPPPRLSPKPFPPEKEQELPVLAHQEKILELVRNHRVVCIEGETGCGKSTKIPQFVLDDCRRRDSAIPCRILVTQPRRVAAIKLAERVAVERRERIGQTVGYCIGGEKHQTSDTALTYCTVGYLLHALIHNPSMILRYTHIVLDEIHERSTDTDFALIIVRKLVASSNNLKVIIMSATMESHAVAAYFEEMVNFTDVADPYFVGAKRYHVERYFIDELDRLADVERDVWNNWQTTASVNLKNLILKQPPENLQDALMETPRVTDFAMTVCTELIISQANLGEQVLVFLPGISEITTYYDRLMTAMETRNLSNHFAVFVMHSQVPFEDQKEVFKPPPASQAHVILATNIAESSITLPRLRLVINFGIYRQLEYNSKRHMSQLTKKWCSHASCAQRAGRAGRVFEGVAVHLFTKRFFWVIAPEFDPPEILHAPLAKLVLQAKQIGSKMGIPSPSEFLSQAMDPPSLEQMELALKELASFGAIVSLPGLPVLEEAEITLLGRFALTLPLDIEFSRLVLYGIFFGIPTDAIIIAGAASLSQDVFSLPTRMVLKEEATYGDSLRRSMKSRYYHDGGEFSDSIMVRHMFREWIEYKNTVAASDNVRLQHTFLRFFSNNHSVRWQRLLQLEHSIAEIASRVLPLVPKEYHLYDDIRVLSDITSYRRGFSFVSDLDEDGSSKSRRRMRLCNVELHFCDDVNVLKALMAAAFTHNFIVGQREIDSPVLKDRTTASQSLYIMTEQGYNPSETVTLVGSPSTTVRDVQHLTSVILPRRSCEFRLIDRKWYVHLHPEFDKNPKTSLMRAHVTNQEETNASPGSGLWSNTSVVFRKPSPDICYLWQYGERKPTWKVADAIFSRPRHPLSVCWTRISKEKERVMVSSWRNPSGYVCEIGEGCLPFLGVVSFMQGIQHRNVVSCRGVTVLPSLLNGKKALLMLLAFQPQDVKLDFIMKKGVIAGLKLDGVALQLPCEKLRMISAGDIVRINELRRVLSQVMRVSGELNHCLPIEEMYTLRALLECVLKGSPTDLTSPLDNPPPCSTVCEPSLQHDNHNEHDDGSEFEFESTEAVLVGGTSEVPLSSFQYYPPIECPLLEAVIIRPIPRESLETHHLFRKRTSHKILRRSTLPPSSTATVDQRSTLPPSSTATVDQQEQMSGFRAEAVNTFDNKQQQLHCNLKQVLEPAASFRLSPLAEPFVPTVPNVTPPSTRPPLLATHALGSVSQMPVQSVEDTSTLGLQGQIGQDVSVGGSLIEGVEEHVSTSNQVPSDSGAAAPPPRTNYSESVPNPILSLASAHDPTCNLQSAYGMLLQILNSASRSGEELLKAKAICNYMYLLSSAAMQSQASFIPPRHHDHTLPIQYAIPHPKMPPEFTPHHNLPSQYAPHPVSGESDSWKGSKSHAQQSVHTSVTSEESREATNGNGYDFVGEDEKEDADHETKQLTDGQEEVGGASTMAAQPPRPLRSPTTGLVEERPTEEEDTRQMATSTALETASVEGGNKEQPGVEEESDSAAVTTNDGANIDPNKSPPSALQAEDISEQAVDNSSQPSQPHNATLPCEVALGSGAVGHFSPSAVLADGHERRRRHTNGVGHPDGSMLQGDGTTAGPLSQMLASDLSRLSQALLSPPHNVPLPLPQPLARLAALQVNQPPSAFFSQPRPPFGSSSPPGLGFIHRSAPLLSGRYIDAPPSPGTCFSQSVDSGAHPLRAPLTSLTNQQLQDRGVPPPQGVPSHPSTGNAVFRCVPVTTIQAQRQQLPSLMTSPRAHHRGQRSQPIMPQHASAAAPYNIPNLQPPNAQPVKSHFTQVRDVSQPGYGNTLMGSVPNSQPQPSYGCQGHKRQAGARSYARKTPKPMMRYQGPPQPGGSNSSLPPGLNWPLPLPPLPPSSTSHRRRRVPPPPPQPLPLAAKYTARHEVPPLMQALLPTPNSQVHNHQASGLNVYPLHYDKSLRDNLKSKGRTIPSYVRYGLNKETLVDCFSAMLITKGDHLELNVLCGPYYRDILKSYRACVTENELLDPSFFTQHSRFTVYGEPGRFMVKLNPIDTDRIETSGTSETQCTIVTGENMWQKVDTKPLGSLSEPEALQGECTVPQTPHTRYESTKSQSEISKASLTQLESSQTLLRNTDALQADQETTESSQTQPETSHNTETSQMQLEASEKQPETLQTQPETSQAQAKTMLSQLETSQVQLETLQTQPETLQTQPETLQTQAETMLTQPETSQVQLETLQTQPKTSQAQPETSQAQAKTMLSQLETSQVQLETLQTQPETLQTQPETLQTQAETMLTQPETSQVQLETLQTQPKTSQAQPETSQAQAKTMLSQLETSQVQLETLQTQPETLQTQPETLQTQAETMLTQPETSQVQLETLQTQPETLQTQPETLQTQPETMLTQPETSQVQLETSLIQTKTSLIQTETLLTQPETSQSQTDTTEASETQVEAAEASLKLNEGTGTLLMQHDTTEAFLTQTDTTEVIQSDGIELEVDNTCIADHGSSEGLRSTVDGLESDNLMSAATNEGGDGKQSQLVSVTDAASAVEGHDGSGSIKEDWKDGVQLPPAAADLNEERPYLATGEGTTGAVATSVAFDENCWIESGDLTPGTHSASQTVLEPEQKQPASTTVFDEDCWQESVAPECASVATAECVPPRPIRILKREDSTHEPFDRSKRDRSSQPYTGGGVASKSGQRETEGPVKRKKSKGKRKNKWDRDVHHEGRSGRFSPALSQPTRSGSGRSGRYSPAPSQPRGGSGRSGDQAFYPREREERRHYTEDMKQQPMRQDSSGSGSRKEKSGIDSGGKSYDDGDRRTREFRGRRTYGPTKQRYGSEWSRKRD